MSPGGRGGRSVGSLIGSVESFRSSSLSLSNRGPRPFHPLTAARVLNNSAETGSTGGRRPRARYRAPPLPPVRSAGRSPGRRGDRPAVPVVEDANAGGRDTDVCVRAVRGRPLAFDDVAGRAPPARSAIPRKVSRVSLTGCRARSRRSRNGRRPVADRDRPRIETHTLGGALVADHAARWRFGAVEGREVSARPRCRVSG